MKIIHGDLIIEVTDEAELQMVKNVFGKSTKSVYVKSDSTKPAPDKDSFIKLYKGMSDNAKRLIDTLKEKPEGVNIAILEGMGLKGSVLGGTRGAITKSAIKSGIKPEDVMKTDNNLKPQMYYIGAKMLEVFK